MLSAASVANHGRVFLGAIQEMEPPQDLSAFSSLPQLLEELDNLIALESTRSSNPWIRVTKLGELFCEKYGVSLEEAAKAQGHSGSLRSLFTSSKRFSIYSTPIPHEFYVALFQAVLPSLHQPQARRIEYRIKRTWKVDGNLMRMLKAEGAEEILSWQTQNSQYQPVLPPEIRSVSDLELALLELIKRLTANGSSQAVTIAALSQQFRECYGQPIKTVMRDVCSELKLVDLLQTIPDLQVQKVDDEWRITLKAHSAE